MSRRSRHGRRPPFGAPPSPSDQMLDHPQPEAAQVPVAAAVAVVVSEPVAPVAPALSTPTPQVAPAPRVAAAPTVPMVPMAPPDEVPASQLGDAEPSRTTCTQAQLRRFIKSRPWIPMHELRRRFGISGVDDDVTPVRIGATTIYVGLPPSEGRMLGELLSNGDVGYELSLDPNAPIVVGVYPMRPVPRG